MNPERLDAIHSNNSYEACGPRFGEYPIALLTRRTLGLMMNDVVEQRYTAPNRVGYPSVSPRGRYGRGY